VDKYEYKTEKLPEKNEGGGEFTFEGYTRWLNKHGDEGWMFCAEDYNDKDTFVIFMRKKS